MRKKRDKNDWWELPTEGQAFPVLKLRTVHPAGHPWVFRRMCDGELDLRPGSMVEVIDSGRRFVGRGFYNPNSEIAVRLLTTSPDVFPGAAYFRETFARAASLRRDVLKLDKITDAYRLIHSEGDGLSGLVADVYPGCVVLEVASAGIHHHMEWIKSSINAEFPGSEIIIKADHRTEKLEGVKMDGPPPVLRTLTIREHNLKLHVDLRRGHKTGFFLDQRDNRRRIAALAPGMTVFDGFCYTGGFGLSAALGGAKSVESCDLDEKAIEIAEDNKALNGIADDKLKFTHGNVFDVLRDHRSANNKFDLMILDPAKQTMMRSEIGRALSAYADMNRLGMRCMRPGGVLLSCSCTGLITEEDFLLSLRTAASEAQCDLQIIGVHGAPPDHPWSIHAPEGRYLKAVFSRVYPRN